MAEMMTTNYEKKYYDKDDFASKGVAGTALGLSIGALGTQLLNGNLNLGNLLGNNNQTNQELFGIYKGYRDADDAIIAKHNADSFALYKNQRDEKDCLQKQIDAINTKLAVTETNQFWQMKNLTDAIALEAERRNCNDGKLVNYMNTTFAPKYIADFTVGTTTTQQTIFNPLCTPNCGC
jgi:hypothetical protein